MWYRKCRRRLSSDVDEFPLEDFLGTMHALTNLPFVQSTPSPVSIRMVYNITGLRKVIIRRMQNVLESLWVGDHEPILLDEPQW